MASNFDRYGYHECLECGATFRNPPGPHDEWPAGWPDGSGGCTACGSKGLVSRDAAVCLSCGAHVDSYGNGYHLCEDGELDDYGFDG